MTRTASRSWAVHGPEPAAIPVALLGRDEQMAFWLNLCNAPTVPLVLERDPVEGISDIPPGLCGDGPWGAELVEVEGEPLSPGDIEHRLLRPSRRDPRVHDAVSRAAAGRPDLAAEPPRGAGPDRRLDRAAAACVDHRRGVAVEDGELVVSKDPRLVRGGFRRVGTGRAAPPEAARRPGTGDAPGTLGWHRRPPL